MEPFSPFLAKFAAAQKFSLLLELAGGPEPTAQLLLFGFFRNFLVLLFLTGLFVLPLFLGQADATAVVVFAAEAGELAQDFLRAFPALVGVGDVIELLDGVQELDGYERAEAVGDGHTVGDFALVVGFEVFGVFDEGLDLFACLLEVEPGLVAAVFPLGEVLPGDGAGTEFFSEHVFAFG
jgi:hypothetical protein